MKFTTNRDLMLAAALVDWLPGRRPLPNAHAVEQALLNGDARASHVAPLEALFDAHADSQFITRYDTGWPTALMDLDDLPFALWWRGSLDALSPSSSVAIVGSRACTEYGSRVAADLAGGLADRGWRTVSGGAYGIDIAAHRAALAHGSPTVVVLACGADRAYPVAHREVFDRIVEGGGCIISEYPPGSTPLRTRFLARNRIIAALSAGMVVVESNIRSGSMAAARSAAALRRPLMAVPGPVTSVQSTGTHELIRTRQASLVTQAIDVLDAIAEHRR